MRIICFRYFETKRASKRSVNNIKEVRNFKIVKFEDCEQANKEFVLKLKAMENLNTRNQYLATATGEFKITYFKNIYFTSKY